MADKITLTDRIYILKRVNYGSDVDTTITQQIIQEVDPLTLEINDDQVTHVGVTRNGDLVSDILDDLLYEDLAVSSFTINGATSVTREKGNTLDTINLAWAYNKAVTAQSISGVAPLDPADRTKQLTAQGLLVDTTWLLTGNDGTNDATESVSALFRHSLRWIAQTDQVITSVLLQSWNAILKADKSHTFTVTAGAEEYIYFASPQSYGTVTFTIGGFEEIFTETAFDYVNSYGVSTPYFIYKSANKGLGLTTVITS